MTNNTKIDFIYLSEQDMIRAGVTDMRACVDTMEEMFGLLHQVITEWPALTTTRTARW
jgi:ornithine cyclodeaminase